MGAVLKMTDYREPPAGLVSDSDEVAHSTPQKEGAQPGAQPVRNLVTNQDEAGFSRDWLTFEAAQELLGVSRQAIQKGIEKGKYQARQVESEKGGGAAGKKWQIYADSLPEPARSRWYSRFPVALPTPQTLAVSLADKFVGVANVEGRLRRALWIEGIIKPALAAKKGKARSAAIAQIIETTQQRWDSKAVKLNPQTVYHWIREAESGGLVALSYKARADRGAKRIRVSRAWDKAFIPLLGNEKAEELAADLWQYAASLWGNNANGERIIMEFAGQRLRELTAKAMQDVRDDIPLVEGCHPDGQGKNQRRDDSNLRDDIPWLGDVIPMGTRQP
jgi:hypothetical protein